MRHFELLVTGRAGGLDGIAALFAGDGRMHVAVRTLEAGRYDPLADLHQLPDGAVISLSGSWREELEALAARAAAERLPMVVIGPHQEPAAMRLAMRAGARDFLPAPAAAGELLNAVEAMVMERRAADRNQRGSLTAVINTKGGAGGSTVAANCAHILAASARRRTVLVDLDLQFGALPLHFDMQGEEGIVEALARVESLDQVAVEGYMLRHPSGLHLLAGAGGRTQAPQPCEPARLSRLFDLLLGGYEQVIADLPRQLGPVTMPVLAAADTLLLVIQQSVAHLRDAKQLTTYLSRQLGVTSDRLWVVVNRYEKRLPITSTEIAEVLNPGRMVLLRNDYARVAASIDLGVPLLESARNAPLTRELVELVEALPGVADAASAARGGIAQRLLRWARA